MKAAPRGNDRAAGSQRAASDPAVSAWVAANAGTGKTWVLVDRVIRLMLGGARPDRILCLTFTRAAAAEMANRLYQRLGEWTTLSDDALRKTLGALTGEPASVDDLAPARRLFARALDTPGGLKIQTIHAFCEALIGRFPLEAGIAPHFAVMDERSSAEMLEEARDHVLAVAQDGGDDPLAAALGRVVGLADEEAFARIMAELAAHRGRLLRMLAARGGLEGLIAATRSALGLGPGETEASLIEAACADAAFDGEGLGRAAAALAGGSDADKARADVIGAWLNDKGGRADGLRGSYAEVFLTKAGAPRAESGLITKAAREADPGAAAILLGEQARLGRVMDRLRAVAVAESTAALLRLAAALLAAFESRKASQARLDYDDLILTARALLSAEGGASWALYKLDGGIDHILIDEAQDTSPEQWDVIKALSAEFFAGEGARTDRPGPRTLFAVGDEKQSIFSFQGADPDFFDHMRSYFDERVSAAAQRFLPVELALSFRSAPAVLKAVDLVFAAEGARDGVTAGRAIRHSPVRTGAAGLVELWPTVTPQEAPEARPWDLPLDQLAADSPPARLAARIAERIARWLDGGEILESRGRPIRPGDIMILVRRRNAFFDEMVRALKQRGVAVAGTDRMVLREQLAVMDLAALGEFLLLPEDDLTLAVVLKGPLFGFTDTDLFDLAYGRRGSLWSALKRRRRDRPPFEAACGELSSLLAKADYVTPFALYAELLGPGRGRRRILARLGPDAGDPIDEFLSLALEYGRSHAPSLRGFLHWLGASRTEVKRDLEQGRNEVRVMTVHGAKGLESNIVFLPDTCAVPDHSHDDKLLWTAAEGGPVMLWPVRSRNLEAVSTAARDEARRRRMQEYRRLLYVAMTRACDRLYVCGWETKRGRGAGCWYDLISAALRAQAEEVALDFGETGWRLRHPQQGPPDDKPGAGDEAYRSRPPPAWAQAAPGREKTPPRPLAPSRPTEAEPPAISPLAPAPARPGTALLRGRLVHHLLEVLPEIDPRRRAAACRRYLARPVHGLTAAAQREIAAETLAVLEDAAFAPLFGPGSRAEVPLAGVVGRTVVSGQVDRLLVGERQVLVVDYKTNRPAPAAPEEVPVAYLKQMAAYRALLADIYPGRAVRCALLWTGAARLMALDDDLLTAHSP